MKHLIDPTDLTHDETNDIVRQKAQMALKPIGE